MACDVLNLEWSSSGRDREVATAVCHALRARGFSVLEESVFNYRYLLLRHRPRLLYLADPKGARINFEAALFAERLGVPIVSIDAEGNYPEGGGGHLWGHVADGRLRERLKLHWSTRARDLWLAAAPELAGKLKVSGGVGFDRYRHYRFASPEEWRKKYGFRQQRIVGFATWAFDRVSTDDSPLRGGLSDRDVERLRHDRDAVRELLGELAHHHPDMLFLLKEHPAVLDPSATEIAGLGRLENVLIIKNEEPIGDCINVCDVWMAYESTTCIEAWLLGKPTLFINPSGGDFPRSNVHAGTPVLETLEAVEGALARHEATGRIEEFEAKADGRRDVLTNVVQWTDGKNHLRAGYFFEQVLEEPRKRQGRIGVGLRLAALSHGIQFYGARYFPSLPGFRHYAPARERFDPAQLKRVQHRVAVALDSFGDRLTDQDLVELERLNS